MDKLWTKPSPIWGSRPPIAQTPGIPAKAAIESRGWSATECLELLPGKASNSGCLINPAPWTRQSHCPLRPESDRSAAPRRIEQREADSQRQPILHLSPRTSYRYNCTEDERLSVGIPLIQQAKIQAQVLVPLVKALQAELGEERANALVRRALGDIYRRYGEEFWRTKNEKNLGKSVASAFATFAREDALDYRVR